MNALSVDEIARMRETQGAAMGDVCTLSTWASTLDAYGTEINTPVLRTGVACGLDVSPAGAREIRRSNGTIVNVAATLRLSISDGAALTEKDSVIVTARNGESVTMSFGIAAIQRGTTGYMLQLEAVR